MNKAENRCYICKKRFRNEEIDYCCDSCQDDLSDSERKIEVCLRKKKRIRKRVEGKEGNKLKLDKKSPSCSTSQEMVEQFNDNIYTEQRLSLTSEQYDYFVYLTLNREFLTEQDKHRLAEINSRAFKHQTESQDKVMSKCTNFGYEKSQIWSFIHYMESEAPIVIYFNVNNEITQFLRDPLVSTPDRVTKNGIVGQISICSDMKISNSHKCYGESFLVLKDTVRKRCFIKGQSDRNHVPYTNLIYSEHMLAGLANNELKKSIDSLYSEQQGLSKEIFIMGKILLNKHVEAIYVSQREARGDYHAILTQIKSKYGVDFQIF